MLITANNILIGDIMAHVTLVGRKRGMAINISAGAWPAAAECRAPLIDDASNMKAFLQHAWRRRVYDR